MSRPTDPQPDFATGGAADVQEPGAGKKQQGWVTGEIPPAGTFNWLHRTTARWLTYASAVLGGTEGDFRLISTRTSDVEPVLDAAGAPTSAYKLLARVNAAGNRGLRLYSGSGVYGGALVLGAAWSSSSSAWVLDNVGTAATALFLDDTHGVRVLHKAAGSSPWGATAWDTTSRLSVTNLYADSLYGTGSSDISDLTSTAIHAVTCEVATRLRLAPGAALDHATPRTITVLRDLRNARPVGNGTYQLQGAGSSAGEIWQGGVGGVDLDVSLDLPVGATLISAKARVSSSFVTGSVTLEVFRQQGDTRVQCRSGGSVTGTPPGTSVPQDLTYTADQNGTLGAGQSMFARVHLIEASMVAMPLEVTYTTLSARHF